MIALHTSQGADQSIIPVARRIELLVFAAGHRHDQLMNRQVVIDDQQGSYRCRLALPRQA
jgi:hypothetical protein